MPYPTDENRTFTVTARGGGAGRSVSKWRDSPGAHLFFHGVDGLGDLLCPGGPPVVAVELGQLRAQHGGGVREQVEGQACLGNDGGLIVGVVAPVRNGVHIDR